MYADCFLLGGSSPREPDVGAARSASGLDLIGLRDRTAAGVAELSLDQNAVR